MSRGRHRPDEASIAPRLFGVADVAARYIERDASIAPGTRFAQRQARYPTSQPATRWIEMNQNGMSRWFQIALCGSSTKAQNDSDRQRGEHHAESIAHGEGDDAWRRPASTMIHRSPAAPPVALNQPSVEKIARRFDTLHIRVTRANPRATDSSQRETTTTPRAQARARPAPMAKRSGRE